MARVVIIVGMLDSHFTIEIRKLANYRHLTGTFSEKLIIDRDAENSHSDSFVICFFGFRTLSFAKGMNDRRQMVWGGESVVLKSEITREIIL